MPVIHVHSIQEFNALVQQGAAIIDFSATWCGPCRNIAPHFEQLSNHYPHIRFIKVDVDELEDVAQHFGVSAMPTFKVLVNGQLVNELVGADLNELKQLVANI